MTEKITYSVAIYGVSASYNEYVLIHTMIDSDWPVARIASILKIPFVKVSLMTIIDTNSRKTVYSEGMDVTL